MAQGGEGLEGRVKQANGFVRTAGWTRFVVTELILSETVTRLRPKRRRARR